MRQPRGVQRVQGLPVHGIQALEAVLEARHQRVADQYVGAQYPGGPFVFRRRPEQEVCRRNGSCLRVYVDAEEVVPEYAALGIRDGNKVPVEGAPTAAAARPPGGLAAGGGRGFLGGSAVVLFVPVEEQVERPYQERAGAARGVQHPDP